jgi:hypothetical protein
MKQKFTPVEIEITLTQTKSIVIYSHVNKDDWDKASTDARNDYIKDKIKDYLDYNMDEFLKGHTLKIDLIPS